MESQVFKTVHKYDQRTARYIISSIDSHIRPIRLAHLGFGCVREAHDGFGIPQHQPDVVGSNAVFTSRRRNVNPFCQLPQLGGQGSQQPLHFPSTVWLNKHQEPLAVLWGPAGNVPGRPGRDQTVQHPAPVFVGVPIRDGVRHPPSQLPRLRVGKPPIASGPPQLGDALNLFLRVTHNTNCSTNPTTNDAW